MKKIPCPKCGQYGKQKSLNMALIIAKDCPGLCVECERKGQPKTALDGVPMTRNLKPTYYEHFSID